MTLIKCGMFVRCAIDNEKYSRDYAIGKVKSVDDFSKLPCKLILLFVL